MKARMKFLVESLGWETFRRALDEERKRVGPVPLTNYLEETQEFVPESTGGSRGLKVLDPRTSDPQFQTWARDSVIDHKISGFRGVHVRVKLGDLTAARARGLAEVVREFSSGQLRISIEQNIYLPWVREEELSDLYAALAELSLADRGVGTITDVTTCPGSDTCRLGIASAKGLGSALAGAPGNDVTNSPIHPPQASLRGELVKPLRIKVSGCPNGCAQHSIANIGFYAAALSQEDHSVPAYFVTLGGQISPESAQFGSLLGKFPAKNCVPLTETLLGLYEKERLPAEEFNSFLSRTGTKRLKEILDPLRHVPSFETDPSFYEDYGHEHESFAVRRGIKGECAGSTVAETLPTIEAARERLAQAEALIHHREYEEAGLASYEAAAAAARVPLYQRLVDPFTADEALWEFENLFVLSGETGGMWEGLSSRFEQMKNDVRQASLCCDGSKEVSEGNQRQAEVYRTPDDAAREILDEARRFVSYCALPLSQRSGVAA
jgi:sulfite reductase (ferredoxin)